MSDAAYIATLADEITQDPLARGYATMADDAVATDLADKYRLVWRDTVPGQELLESIDDSDWVNITESERDLVLNILAIGDLDPQGFARRRMLQVFGAGSATISAMATIARTEISRWAELAVLAGVDTELPRAIDVQIARGG